MNTRYALFALLALGMATTPVRAQNGPGGYDPPTQCNGVQVPCDDVGVPEPWPPRPVDPCFGEGDCTPPWPPEEPPCVEPDNGSGMSGCVEPPPSCDPGSACDTRKRRKKLLRQRKRVKAEIAALQKKLRRINAQLRKLRKKKPGAEGGGTGGWYTASGGGLPGVDGDGTTIGGPDSLQ